MDQQTAWRMDTIDDAIKANQDDPERIERLEKLRATWLAEAGVKPDPIQDEQPRQRRDNGTDRGSRTRTQVAATDAQYRFIARLRGERDTSAAKSTTMMGVMLDRADNETLAKRDASELIDWLQEQPANKQATPSGPMASDKQMGFIASLCDERGLPVPADLTKAQASNLITELLAAPKPARRPATSQAKTEVTEGMYRKDEVIYKVQIAHHGSGRPYAKKLVQDEEGQWSFEYAAGALRNLTPADKLSLEEAKKFGALYGWCCVCATILTNEKSIAEGIGPVCAKKF